MRIILDVVINHSGDNWRYPFADVMRACEPLRFGRMYFRGISGDGVHFGRPFGTDYTLAFSRLLYPREVLVAYNVSGQARNDCVVVDAALHRNGDTLTFLHRTTAAVLGASTVPVEVAPDGTHYVQLNLAAREFAILE